VAVAVGGIADLIESILDKSFVRFGKPDAYMFSYSFGRASALSPGLRRKDILMVGDTLDTDIRGGNKFGIDTVLVLSGNTARDSYQLSIDASGVIPDFICENIAPPAFACFTRSPPRKAVIPCIRVSRSGTAMRSRARL
jgi:ribonucleotide monophosphatase NagD (HAD superfamily)